MPKEIEKSKLLSNIIAKQTDVINKKVFIFLAVAGGSWLYGIKIGGYLGLIIWLVFILSAIGVIFNLTKMGILHKELEDLKNV